MPWGCVFSIRGVAWTQEEMGEEEQHGPSTPGLAIATPPLHQDLVAPSSRSVCDAPPAFCLPVVSFVIHTSHIRRIAISPAGWTRSPSRPLEVEPLR